MRDRRRPRQVSPRPAPASFRLIRLTRRDVLTLLGRPDPQSRSPASTGAGPDKERPMTPARPRSSSSSPSLVAFAGLSALALVLPACAPDPGIDPGGSGGAPGSSGGVSGSGGAVGSGGSSSSG